MSSHSNNALVCVVASTIGSFCLLLMELKSLADDRVRTGVCKLLSNLCCYELLSTSGFLRFDIYYIYLLTLRYGCSYPVKVVSPPPSWRNRAIGILDRQTWALEICLAKGVDSKDERTSALHAEYSVLSQLRLSRNIQVRLAYVRKKKT